MPRRYDVTEDSLLKRKERLMQTARSLVLEDWLFSDCPADELPACCYYEYARASDKIKERVAMHWASNDWESRYHPSTAEFYRNKWFTTFFSSLSEFPDTPWLKIDPTKRRAVYARCEQIEGPFVSVDPDRLRDGTGQRSLYPSDVGPNFLHSVHAIEIDWTSSDAAILEAFSRWMDFNRPTQDVVVQSRRRGGDREVLRFLGAYRLMKTFKKNSIEAREWADEYGREGDAENSGFDWTPQYSDHSGWLKAYRKAKRLIGDETNLTPAGMCRPKQDAAEIPAKEQAKVRRAIQRVRRASGNDIVSKQANATPVSFGAR